ncbi:ATP-binding protein [Nocardiopsis sp. NPDC058631]|uniref:ATP-binding protein n=1 Tax=Nocardiopsis sp. NPDC058631 TaxID=3346566 RepID=UPI00364E560B
MAYFDGRADQLSRVRSWCLESLRLPEDRAAPSVLVLSELVANAVRHTASGTRFGRVRVQLEVLPGTVVVLAVTDDGPRSGQQITLPHLSPRSPQDGCLREGGRGLLLVSALAEEWWWTGLPGAPLTVHAMVDPHRDLPAPDPHQNPA